MKDFSNQIQDQFVKMCETGQLFVSSVTGQQVWETYLNSFTPEQNPVFRDPESSTYNCNHCYNFLRRYGNIIALDKDLKVMTLFDVTPSVEYQKTVKDLTKLFKSASIADVFTESLQELNEAPYEKLTKNQEIYKLGFPENVKVYSKEEAEMYGGGIVSENEVRTFHHMYLQLPKKFVIKGESIASFKSKKNSNFRVFERGMKEISLETLELVRDLINQGSIMNAESQVGKLEEIIKKKKEYDKVAAKNKTIWCWRESVDFVYAAFRNELLGVLCVDLTTGVPLEKACQDWNKRVDPKNWMKATAPFTESQKRAAMKKVEEGGYTESFNRRLAVIDDIRASEIIHMNTDGGSIVKNASIFDNISSGKTKTKELDFKGVKEVTIENFMEKILPTAGSVEVYFQNQHEGNLMTMTTSENPDNKALFKYGNNYSRTFKGNLSGRSEIKEAVKMNGGEVDGILRISLMWSEGTSQDNSDLDLHCTENDEYTIYYGNRRTQSPCGGTLDVDIIRPISHKASTKKPVVENIIYTDPLKIDNSDFLVKVNQYAGRNSTGFKLEIEFEGTIHHYVYDKQVTGTIKVAAISVKDGVFSIKNYIKPSESIQESRTIYGIETNKFHKVNLLCLSPNHWDDKSIGNKQYLFFLEGCETLDPVRSFHVEDLVDDLYADRRVLDAVGAANLIIPQKGQPQLSGLGFNSTVRDEVFVKVGGTHNRVLKVKF